MDLKRKQQMIIFNRSVDSAVLKIIRNKHILRRKKYPIHKTDD